MAAARQITTSGAVGGAGNVDHRLSRRHESYHEAVNEPRCESSNASAAAAYGVKQHVKRVYAGGKVVHSARVAGGACVPA